MFSDRMSLPYSQVALEFLALVFLAQLDPTTGTIVKNE